MKKSTEEITKEQIEACQEILSRNLRVLRVEWEFTQKELAEKAEVSLVTISNLERGTQTKPTKKTITKIAKALDVSPQELLTQHQSVSKLTGLSKQLSKKLLKSDSSQDSNKNSSQERETPPIKRGGAIRKIGLAGMITIVLMTVGVGFAIAFGAKTFAKEREISQTGRTPQSRKYTFVAEEIGWFSPIELTLIDTPREREIVQKGLKHGLIADNYGIDVEKNSDFVLNQNNPQGFEIFPLSVVQIRTLNSLPPTQNEEMLLPVDVLIVYDPFLLDPIKNEVEVQQILRTEIEIVNPIDLAVGSTIVKLEDNNYFVASKENRAFYYSQIDPIAEGIKYIGNKRLPPKIKEELLSMGGKTDEKDSSN